jgi:hypothetical protein
MLIFFLILLGSLAAAIPAGLLYFAILRLAKPLLDRLRALSAHQGTDQKAAGGWPA